VSFVLFALMFAVCYLTFFLRLCGISAPSSLPRRFYFNTFTEKAQHHTRRKILIVKAFDKNRQRVRGIGVLSKSGHSTPSDWNYL